MSTSGPEPVAARPVGEATPALAVVPSQQPSPSEDTQPSSVPQPAESAARLLHPSQLEGAAVDTEILREIAAGLAASVGAPPVLAEGAIQRTRLLATEGYDAWLMVWGPGATIGPHDHDGSIGVLHVIDGTLVETIVTDSGHDERHLPTGDTTEFAATHRHALTNPLGTTSRTVNVYSPPLGSATPG